MNDLLKFVEAYPDNYRRFIDETATMAAQVDALKHLVRKGDLPAHSIEIMLPVADVKPDSTLESLGIDSLGLVESIFAIEEAFDISVPFNANDPGQSEFDISSVDAIVRAVEKLVADQT